jgi:hypothetical protein
MLKQPNLSQFTRFWSEKHAKTAYSGQLQQIRQKYQRHPCGSKTRKFTFSFHFSFTINVNLATFENHEGNTSSTSCEEHHPNLNHE